MRWPPRGSGLDGGRCEPARRCREHVASAEPWRFDFFAVLRSLERTIRTGRASATPPRSARNSSRSGRTPTWTFRPRTLSRVRAAEGKAAPCSCRSFSACSDRKARCRSRRPRKPITGSSIADDAFPRFLDIFNHRFLQLFFRAWADARPIAQHDRPDADRFVDLCRLDAIGLGSAIFRGPRLASRTRASSLSPASSARRPNRASRLARLHPRPVRRRVEDRRIRRLAARARAERLHAARRATMRSASDTLVGASVYSVQDKFRIRIYVADMTQYRRFLPTGDLCEPLADLGVLLCRRRARLGCRAGDSGGRRRARASSASSAQLGWTDAGCARIGPADRRPYRRRARFHPAERHAARSGPDTGTHGSGQRGKTWLTSVSRR